MTIIRKYFWTNPLLWFFLLSAVYFHISSLIPNLEWNMVEIMIGQNLMHGHGYVVTPGDPPALWRPPLVPFLTIPLQLFTNDVRLIFQLVYSLAVTSLGISLFYTAKRIWSSLAAAHFAAFLVATQPVFYSYYPNIVHAFSHIGFTLVIGPAIYFSILSIQTPTRFSLFLTSFTWLLVYFSRPETILFFGLISLFIGLRIYNRQTLRNGITLILFLLIPFVTIFTGHKEFTSREVEKYGLMGHTSIITFYNSEGWNRLYQGLSISGDIEKEGYLKAIEIYGTPEANNFSVLETIKKNPFATYQRIRGNFPLLIKLLWDGTLIHPWVGFLILIGAIYAIRRSQTLYFSLFFLMAIVVGLFLIFHINPRYISISVPAMILMGVAGFAGIYETLKTHLTNAGILYWGYRKILGGTAMVLGILVFASNSVTPLFSQLKKSPKLSHLNFGKALGHAFTRDIQTPSEKYINITLPNGFEHSPGVDFTVIYFTQASKDWGGGGDIYPRDRIFSFWDKNPSPDSIYLYLPEDRLYSTNVLLKKRPIHSVHDELLGNYYLFKYDSINPVQLISKAEQNKLKSILTHSYPHLLEKFRLEKFRSKIKIQLLPQKTYDFVSCSASIRKDLAPDNMFYVEIPSEIPHSKYSKITEIRLRRKNPMGINITGGHNYALGVSLNPKEGLINKADGKIEIFYQNNSPLKIWLFSAADGHDTSRSQYYVEIQFSKGDVLQTSVISYQGARQSICIR